MGENHGVWDRVGDLLSVVVNVIVKLINFNVAEEFDSDCNY